MSSQKAHTEVTQANVFLRHSKENTNSPCRIYTSKHTTKTLLSNALETNSHKLWIKAVERLGTMQTQA